MVSRRNCTQRFFKSQHRGVAAYQQAAQRRINIEQPVPIIGAASLNRRILESSVLQILFL
ncbi:MAG: hypothetical protein D6818_11215 [Bacteroidetes bacterium]|nr:MAG: hypothetical protein D6818_11215 [Bacteroidota bacterium]